MKWISKNLGEVVTILSGTTPQTDNQQYWNGNLIWITPSDLSKVQNYLITSSERRISEEGRKSCNLKQIPQNSVIMSSRAPIGYLAIAGCDLFTNQGCKSLVCGPNIDYEYLYFFLKFQMPKIQKMGSGAIFNEVSKSILEKVEITFPESLTDQRLISNKLKSQLYEVEKTHKAAVEQLNEIKLLPHKLLKQAFYVKK